MNAVNASGASTSTSNATYTASASATARAMSSSIPDAAMNSTSGGSRLRAPTSATSCGCTSPASIAIRNGMPHSLPDGELSGVLRSPCASNHDDGQPLVTTRQTCNRPDVGAATAAEDHGKRRQRPLDSGRLLGERRLCDDRGLRPRQPERTRGLGHGLAARAPGARDADEPAAVRPATHVTLVSPVERDRRQRVAVRAARAERAQASCQRRNTRQALCPPNPNEFDTAISTCCSRATFGM